jgi:hypothetical protein
LFPLKIREISSIFHEGCEIENEFPRILIFNISKKNMKLSKIFGEMEKLKSVKGTEENGLKSKDWGLSETTIEDVFMNIHGDQ